MKNIQRKPNKGDSQTRPDMGKPKAHTCCKSCKDQ